jgi:hypothetical protein
MRAMISNLAKLITAVLPSGVRTGRNPREWGDRIDRITSLPSLKNHIINTPLLAAEGFMILRILIQAVKLVL